MENDFKPFVVIGGAHNWGCGKSAKEALANAHKNAYMGRKTYEFDLYMMSKDKIQSYWVDSMGNLEWEWQDKMLGEGLDMERKLYTEGCHIGRFRRKANGHVDPPLK